MKEPPKGTGTGYVGLFFHTWKDDMLEYQGIVRRKISDNQYLVTYFSFNDGAPTSGKIVEFDLLKTTFYLTDKEMRRYYCRWKASQPDCHWSAEDLERSEKRLFSSDGC